MPERDGRLEEFYREALARKEKATAGHLETLYELACECDVVVEFGVLTGASSAALLRGCNEVYSYDIQQTPKARKLKDIVGARWRYIIESSLDVTEIPICDMLFIDSLHTFKQVTLELMRHARRVKHRIVFHDTITFGSVGADGATGRHSWEYKVGETVPIEHMGIRPAIDLFMIANPEWALESHYLNDHGLLVIRRR